MAIREGAWDCPQCGRKRNRGPAKYCEGCGYPRGADVELYLPEDAPEVTDAAALARARSGPDRTCAYCDGDNPADAEYCGGCGAGKDGSKPRPVIEHRDEPPPVQPVAGTPEKPQKPKKKRGCGRTVLGLGCLGLVGLILLVVVGGWFTSRPSVATAGGFEWSRTVEIQQATPEIREAWEGEVPAGARILDTRREVHHKDRTRIGTEQKTRTYTERVQTGTETVKVGTRDLGNGYFEDVYEDRPIYETVERQEMRQEPVYREDPVYRNKVRFQIDAWKTVRTEKDQGSGRSPRWPLVALLPGEREGPRKATYTVIFQDSEGGTRRYATADETEWRSVRQGARYKVRKRGSGEVSEVLGPAVLEQP